MAHLWHTAQHRRSDACSSERVTQPLRVRRAADAVEQQGAQAQLAVKLDIALGHRGGRAGHGRGVQYQQHRGAQPLGKLRGRACLRGAIAAVKQPHHALHHRNVGTRCCPVEGAQHLGGRQEARTGRSWGSGSASCEMCGWRSVLRGTCDVTHPAALRAALQRCCCRTCSRLSIQVSRLMEGRPVASWWCIGSIKSAG